MLSDGGFHVLSVDYRGVCGEQYIKTFQLAGGLWIALLLEVVILVLAFPYHQGTGIPRVSLQRRGWPRMPFVFTSGPRREVVPHLCVSGATLWVQGKWGLKMAFLGGSPWGFGVIRGSDELRREHWAGRWSSGFSHIPHVARDIAISVCLFVMQGTV